MSNPIIRAATDADVPAIGKIQEASPLASQWPPRDYLDYDCLVAEVDGTIAGFLVSRETAPGEREILNVAVHPLSRGKGIGRALLVHEVESHKGEWYLEVRASNIEALNLYEKLHFKRVSVRNNYYSDPPESAIVMRKFS